MWNDVPGDAVPGVPSATLRFATRAEGSCENGQPSPAKQFPITQYLYECAAISVLFLHGRGIGKLGGILTCKGDWLDRD